MLATKAGAKPVTNEALGAALREAVALNILMTRRMREARKRSWQLRDGLVDFYTLRINELKIARKALIDVWRMARNEVRG